METGDPCFAHVRGFPWWPAKVVNKSVFPLNPKREKYEVIFYGTGETASLPVQKLKAASPENIEKFCSPAAMKRKLFQDGIIQMKSEFKWGSSVNLSSAPAFALKQVANPSSVPSVKIVVPPIIVSTAKKLTMTKVCSSNSKVSNPLKEITNVNSGKVNEKVVTAEDNFDWGEFEPPRFRPPQFKPTQFKPPQFKPLKKRDYFASGRKASFTCEDCGEIFALKSTKDLHCLAAHRIDSEDVETVVQASELVDVPAKIVPTKKSKKRSKPTLPKLVKTLREDEAEGNKAFNEKITSSENFFFCKNCDKFSTASKMKARCHALGCGKMKKKIKI